VPNPQTVDGYAEQFDIRPVLQFGGPVRQIGDEAGDFLAEGRQTAATHIVKPALRNNEGALPIVLAVEHHEDPARVKSVKGLSGVPGPPRQSHPQHIHRGSEIDDLETGFLAHRRMTPVGAHDEIGPDGELPVRGFDSHAGHASPSKIRSPTSACVFSWKLAACRT